MLANPKWPLTFALVLGTAAPALAHQSDLSIDALAGNEALMDVGLSGHYGFAHASPWYLFGSLAKGAVPVNPRDDVFRYGLEAGGEGRRFGGAVRFDRLTASGYDLAVQQFGGSVRFRWITWVTLSEEEQASLSREDRQALRESREREALAQVPRAPVISLDYDIFNFNSPVATDLGMQGTRIAATVQWKLHPKLTLFPRIEAYGFVRAPEFDTAASTAFQSRALRMTRIGPHGAYSGVFGIPTGVQQLFARWAVDPLFTLSVGVSRIQLSAPVHTPGSLWIGFSRRLVGRWNKWTISPTYEHVKNGGGTLAFFSVRFNYAFNDPYVP